MNKHKCFKDKFVENSLFIVFLRFIDKAEQMVACLQQINSKPVLLTQVVLTSKEVNFPIFRYL